MRVVVAVARVVVSDVLFESSLESFSDKGEHRRVLLGPCPGDYSS